MTNHFQPGDRVMVVDRSSSWIGETGEVVTALKWTCSVLLDGEDEPMTFHIDELERLL